MWPKYSSEYYKAHKAAHAARERRYKAKPGAKEKRADYARRYRASNPGKVKAWRDHNRLRSKERAAGRPIAECCEICGSTTELCFDHSHATGKFRGWLCHNCNFALGHAKDDPATLRALATYLEGS